MSYGSALLGHFVIILNGQWRLIHLFIICSDHLKFLHFQRSRWTGAALFDQASGGRKYVNSQYWHK